MKKIALCIPTLNRYDLLVKALESAEKGNVVPDEYWIVDNGMRSDLQLIIPPDIRQKLTILRFGYNLGVAASWNQFLKYAGEDKILVICNDDVEFFPETIEKLIEHYDENFVLFPGGVPSANSFSCFLIPEKVYRTVGLFDDTLSPQYAYFEDNDYHYRMLQLGFDLRGIPECRLGHVGSATVNSMPHADRIAHHGKFNVARQNYIRKWGGQPGEEKFKTPYNER